MLLHTVVGVHATLGSAQGMVAKRTVNGWLFTAEDPLLGLLDESLAWHGHFFLNDSSPQVINQPSLEPVYTA